MKSLALREVLDLSRFLQDTYATRDLQAFRTQVVAALPRVVPSDIAGYHEFEHDPARDIWLFHSTHEGGSHAGSKASLPLAPHPVMAHHLRTRDTKVMKVSDFSPLNKPRTNSTCQLRGAELGDQMACVLRYEGCRVVAVTVNRARSEFNERERALMTLLRPHLVQAYQNAEAANHLHRELDSARRNLEQLQRPLVMVDSQGRVDAMSAAACHLLMHYFSPWKESHELPPAIETWVRRRESTTLVTQRNGRQLTIRMTTEETSLRLSLSEQVAILASDAELPCGLTKQESRVLSWVSLGRTNREIGTILGVSARTVQKHLERIFQKLGVESRTAAAARMWELRHPEA
jgi:DNA-binding CsgD family transcriptional regulator